MTGPTPGSLLEGTGTRPGRHPSRTATARGSSLRSVGRLRPAQGKDGYLLVEIGSVTQRTICLRGPVNQSLKTLFAIFTNVLKNRHATPMANYNSPQLNKLWRNGRYLPEL